MKPMLVLAVIAVALGATAQDAAKWQREEKSDPLRGTQFTQFSLQGKYLTAPRNAAPNATPAIVARCQSGTFNHGHARGKFLEGYIFVGSVVDASVSNGANVVVPVQFRLDDGKLQPAFWNHSSDYSSIFFGHECDLWGQHNPGFRKQYLHRSHQKRKGVAHGGGDANLVAP